MSTLPSSPTDPGLEPPDADSRYPSRQTSYHESDAPLFPLYDQSWPAYLSGTDNLTAITAPAPLTGIPGVPSVENIETVLPAANVILQDPSTIPYYTAYPPIIVGDNGKPLDSGQHASSWPAYTPDNGSIDLLPDGRASLPRTDSTLSAELVNHAARASFPGFPRSKSPWKLESERALLRCRSCSAVSPPVESGIKKSRKTQLRSLPSRKNSIQLAVSGRAVKAASDGIAAKLRKHSPSKEEPPESNDEVMSSGDEDSRHRPKNSSKEPNFACPFYRRWPARHMECMSRKLSRIQDVKQHIYRRHSQSPFYCPNCFKDFPSPEPRDKHIRDNSCKLVTASSRRSMDGVSAQIQDELKKRFSRKLSPTRQWYSIWSLIFEDAEAPRNPYLGSMVSETLGMLRDFWKQEGQRLIPGLVRQNPDRAIAEDDLQEFMLNMLNKVEDHFEGDPDELDDLASDAVSSYADQVMDRSPIDGESGASPEDEDNSYKPVGSGDPWTVPLYSPFGSPPTNANGAVAVEPCAAFSSSGLLVEPSFNEQQQQQQQPWMPPMLANPHMNRFQ